MRQHRNAALGGWTFALGHAKTECMAAGRRRNDRKRRLGAHIRSLREGRTPRMSQAQLAAFAGNDLSQSDISKIESGKRWPSVPQLAGILRALGVEDSVLAQFTNGPR